MKYDILIYPTYVVWIYDMKWCKNQHFNNVIYTLKAKKHFLNSAIYEQIYPKKSKILKRVPNRPSRRDLQLLPRCYGAHFASFKSYGIIIIIIYNQYQY